LRRSRLTSSTKTIFKPGANFHEDPDGRNVFFGVREFGMCAAVNGIAAHGGLIPFGSTFFVFSDYAKPAIRLAALMQVHSLFSLHMIRLLWARMAHPPAHRATDGLPRDSRAYGFPARGRQRDGSGMEAGSGNARSSLLALSRQDLPVIDPAAHDLYAGVEQGAYVLEDAFKPQIVLIATGSEVWPCVEAAKVAGGRRNSRAGSQLPSLETLRGTIGGI